MRVTKPCGVAVLWESPNVNVPGLLLEKWGMVTAVLTISKRKLPDDDIAAS